MKNGFLKVQKYKNYTLYDYIEDPDFRRYATNPTPFDKLQWDVLIKNGLVDTKEMKNALLFLTSLHPREYTLDKQSKNDLFANITLHINKKQSNKRYKQKVFCICFFMLVASCLIFFLWNSQWIEYGIKNNQMTNVFAFFPKQDDIDNVLLILPDHETITLLDTESVIRHNKDSVKIEERIMTQVSSKKHNENLLEEYNRLMTPFGKRVHLELEDGSTLWVNSNTKIAYPSVFDIGIREIYVEGEIFLDVAKDANRPFVVHTSKMDIKVLGTKFNVATYATDSVHSVTLVEGLVRINETIKNNQLLLKPNQIYKVGNTESNVENVDPAKFISWTSGIISCKNDRLDDILKQLERYYGQSISTCTEIKNIRCTGKLNLDDELENVLFGLSSVIDQIRVVKKDDDYRIEILKK